MTDPRLERLFAAILVNDVADEELAPPGPVQLDLTAAELDACFALALALWREGLEVPALRRIAVRLLRGRTLDQDARTRFKHVRARFKHLRFAHAMLDCRHRYPPLLDQVTVVMGQAQDAFRHHRTGRGRWYGGLLAVLLAPPALVWLRREAAARRPTTPARLRTQLGREVDDLHRLLAAPTVDGHVFHQARKVVSRMTAFWTTLDTLSPSPARHRLTRWLAAINGDMGRLHDELIARRMRQRDSYRAPFPLPPPIRARLDVLVAQLAAGLAQAEATA